LNMLWKITPEGAAKAVWWYVKEARKKLKKGIVPREVVKKANPVVPRLVAYVIRPCSYVYLSVFNLVHFST
jgi:putative transposase